MFNFTVLHTETTNQSRKNLCSICVVEYVNGEEVVSSHWLVKPPEMKFDAGAKYRHRIIESDLTNKKNLYELREDIFPWLENKTIIAFNANHSIDCIYEAFDELRPKSGDESAGKSLPVFEFICLHTMIWNIFDDVTVKQLNEICELVGYDIDIHDEISKARGCGFVFNHVASKMHAINFHDIKKGADIIFGERMDSYIHSKDAFSLRQKARGAPRNR